MNTETQNPEPKRRKPACVSVLWLLIPLVPAAGFFLIFYCFANSIELREFKWSPVLTNAITNTTNSPSASSSTNQPASRAENAKGTSGTGSGAQGDDRLIKELGIRMYWAMADLGLIFLSLILIIYSMRIINEIVTHSQNSVLPAYVGLGVVAAALYVPCFCSSLGELTPIAGGEAAEQLIKLVENHNDSKTQDLRDKQMPEIKHVRQLLALASAATKLSILFVAIAAGFVLGAMRSEQDTFAGLPQPTAQDCEIAKFKYESRVGTTITLLQFAACTLIVGVIEVYLLYNLASCYIDKRIQGNAQAYAQSIAIVFGLAYSAALIAIFLPLVAGQRLVGKELLASHGGNMVNGQGTKFVAQLDDADPKKAPMVAAIVTVLSPVLVAFLTKLASSLLNL